MKIGEFNLRLIADGEILVDGGAMFGAAPKAVWGALFRCDGQNRIPLAINCLLVETPRTRILVDCGVGTECAAEGGRAESFSGVEGMRRRVEEAGLKVDDIDIMVFSHLHYDHVCGAVEKGGAVFPNAGYIVQAGEWRDAFNTNEFTEGGYDQRALSVLEKTGRVRRIEGDAEISPGVRVRVTGGHTAWHQIVLFESQGCHAAFLADLVPTAAHLPLAHISALDVDPVRTLDAKRLFLREAAAKGTLCVFGHDRSAGCVRHGKAGYIFEVRKES